MRVGNVSEVLRTAHQNGLNAIGMFIKRQSTLSPEPLQSSDVAEFKKLIKVCSFIEYNQMFNRFLICYDQDRLYSILLSAQSRYVF